MTSLYRMPSLGADMEAGTLIEWVLQPGQPFAKGDVIAVVETQKGAIEVEVFHGGVMGRQLVEVGQTVPVGAPLAELEVATVTVPGQEPEAPSGGQPEVQSAEAIAPHASHRPYASPAARRLAQQRGLSLDGLVGTGPGGVIVLADVR